MKSNHETRAIVLSEKMDPYWCAENYLTACRIIRCSKTPLKRKHIACSSIGAPPPGSTSLCPPESADQRTRVHRSAAGWELPTLGRRYICCPNKISTVSAGCRARHGSGNSPARRRRGSTWAFPALAKHVHVDYLLLVGASWFTIITTI